MFDLQYLKEGIRCTVSFDSTEGPKIFPDSELRYTQREGGTLKIAMSFFEWRKDIEGVTVSTQNGKVYIPTARYQSGDPYNRGILSIFHFDHALAGDLEFAPFEDAFDRAEAVLDHGHHYWGKNGVESKTRTIDCVDLHCTRSDHFHTELPEIGSTWINIGFNIIPEGSGRQTVLQHDRLIVDFTDSAIVGDIIAPINKVVNFWEFMLHRPQDPEQIVFSSKHHGRKAHFFQQQKMPTATGAAWYQTGHLQLPWERCNEHLEKLLQCWMKLDHKSPWMDNLLRIIWFRDFPADVRFFMAYTALQGIGAELLVARPLLQKGGKEEERLWKDFESYWGHMLFTLTASREEEEILKVARSYTDRVVLTRHHFAHLSKTDKDIFTGRDLEVAFLRLIMVLKGMFLHKAGAPERTWKYVVEQWAARIGLAETQKFP